MAPKLLPCPGRVLAFQEVVQGGVETTPGYGQRTPRVGAVEISQEAFMAVLSLDD